MTPRGPARSRWRLLLFVAVIVIAVGGASTYAVTERQGQLAERKREPQVSRVTAGAFDDTPRIVFRHTGIDNSYGLVATVALEDPTGPREFTDVACDRVAAWRGGSSCLVIERGVATKFEARAYDAEWEALGTRPLPGIPSRTRVSEDGRLVATTSFVSGHSYMTTGFSTETVVREFNGDRDWGNLEEFTLLVKGRKTAPVDRNVWGVTFAGGNAFYATVSTGGREWLVKGDLERRTLTALAEGAECPSISPDGSQVAYKVDLDPGDKTVWGLALHDLASGERRVLTRRTSGVDDQVTWLDEDTLLYGMPREKETGVTDVWSLDTAPGAQPRLLIEQAWSPTVVR